MELDKDGRDRPGGETRTPRYTPRTSHHGLIPVVRPIRCPRRDGVDPIRGFDAVVVLNHLHPTRVCFASDLAAELGCELVIICTAGYQLRVRATLTSRRYRPPATWVLALDWPAEMPLVGLETVDEPGASSPKYRDVAAKRNVGLALARLLRWKRILFVDDDVRRLTVGRVEALAGLLDSQPQLAAAGWLLEDYPDNSVVCHARRLAGMPQGVTLGGGALAVDITGSLPLFPPVYNEDWLFLYDLIADSRAAVAGSVSQLRFNPFCFPERAREEEFGDLLAEGLFHLLHDGVRDPSTVDHDYWAGVIEARGRMIRSLRTRVGASGAMRAAATPAGRQVMAQASRSLTAAIGEHSVATELERSLAGYVRAWRADLGRWQAWFAELDPADDICGAVKRLGIPADRLVVA